MTPAQLAVERDALLQGGRSPEEVARMQLAGERPSIDPVAVLALPASEDGEGAYIEGGPRCGIYRHWDDWWVGISPRNGQGASVEGPLEDWVDLACSILALEAQRRLSSRPQGETPKREVKP